MLVSLIMESLSPGMQWISQHAAGWVSARCAHSSRRAGCRLNVYFCGFARRVVGSASAPAHTKHIHHPYIIHTLRAFGSLAVFHVGHPSIA